MIDAIKKAIIIGATGLVGRNLLHKLNAQPQWDKITAIVRHIDPSLQQLAKVEQIQIEDFLLLNDADVNGYDHAFSCLGTTIKKAGSKEKFYDIDFEVNAHFADLLVGTQTHLLIVSAQGADAQSRFFYNRVKGELENHLLQLGLFRLSILRPSLLLGERQEKRVLEDLSKQLFGKVSQLLPQSFAYKPVTADQVAHTMVEAALKQSEKSKIYDNLAIQNIE